MRRFFLFISLVCLAPALKSVAQCSFTNKTTANGLGSNVVYGVYAIGSTVYAATDGGLSISTDGGATFKNKTTSNGLGSNTVIQVIATNSTIYAATDGGLSVSTDGGATFANKTTANGLGTNNLRGVYASGSTVYAAILGGGLSISTDGGATFINKTTANGLGSNSVRGVYASGTTVYAATDGGLSISTDGGATFANKTTANGLGSNTVLGVYASGSTVYAATFFGLSVSTDGGATFANKTPANGLGDNYVQGVYASGLTVYAATYGGLSISTDGGATFTNNTTANGLGSNDVFGVYASGSTVYAATSGGLSISTICPPPSVIIAISSGSQTICSGMSVTFTATATGFTSPSYQWKKTSGTTTTNVGTNSATYTDASLSNNDAIQCIVTVAPPIIGGLTTRSVGAQSNTITMTVNPLLTPSVSAAITTGAQTICAGTSVTFTATPTNGGSSPSYQWKKNSANVGTNSATYTDAGLANNDVVVCVLTSNATCASPATASSAGITMTVNPLTAILTQPAAINGCAGQTAPLTLSVSAAGTGLSYQWRKNGQNISGATGASYTVPALVGTGSYDVVVTGTCGTKTSNAAPVTVFPAAVGGTISGGGITQCVFGNLGTLTLSGYSGTICGWQTSPTGLAGSWTNAGNAGQAAYQYASLKQTTYFRALVATDPNCSLCTAVSASAVVNIDQLPSGGTISGFHTVCYGKSITLTVSGVVGQITKWQYADNTLTGNGVWTDIPGTAGATSVTSSGFHSYVQTWYRAVAVNGTCNYTINSTAFMVYPTFCGGGFFFGLAASPVSAPTTLLKAYPSPTTGQATAEITSSAEGKGTIETLDATGRVLTSSAVEVFSGLNEVPIDLTGRPSGIYLIRVKDAEGRVTSVKTVKL